MVKNDRLQGVINFLKKSKCITNNTQFANTLQTNKQGISDLIANRKKYTVDFLKNMIISYPMININWLLTGEGEMLQSECIDTPRTVEYPITGIPIYDIDATCGPTVRDFIEEPIIGYINIPEVKHGTVIVRATGDSMMPVICNNDYVAIREVKDASTIVWGQIYLVILDEYRLIKYLRKHSDEDKLILKSENAAKYDDIIINKADILKLYIIENIMALRTL